MSAERTSEQNESGTETISKPKSRTKRPKRYKVFLLNDDYTTMDFVVRVLETVFQKTPAQAVQIMLSVHKRGSGLCGQYSREIAEAKVAQVHKLAQQSSYPLKCKIES